ncbi:MULTISPECIES: hypothetical protein [Pseudomonas]|uniref:hypothetical protein n=1 Tax=Pseudomonas TaxID=286 RepID=UPI0011851D08|nr:MULTISPECIES: hypothetical protein [Pseudomonas]MBF4558930.1 hypothetical protein [Pseudomonas sp. p50(2008)]
MGFFDKIKELALKAKCATGFHAGNFVKVANGPACHFEKTCPDCYEHVTKKEHRYGNGVYTEFSSCEKSWACEYCDHVKKKIEHEGYRDAGMDDNCRVKEECTRCRHTKVEKENHSWHEASRTEDTIVLWCVRCKKEKTRPKNSF